MTQIDWSYPFACVWGLVVIIALAGWGVLFGRLIQQPPAGQRLGLGTAAVYGLAIYLFISGVLLLVQCFSMAFVDFFLGLGVLSAVGWRGGRQLFGSFSFPREPLVRLIGGVMVFIVVFMYVDAATRRDVNPFDDLYSYLAHSRMMIDTGTLLDPFSFRRMSTYGGQEALQLLLLGFLPWKYAMFLECGVGMLILALCVYDQGEGDSDIATMARYGLVAFAVLYPVPHINSASELSTAVLMLVFLRSLDFMTRHETAGWGGPVLVAFLAGAMSSLRDHNLYAVGVMLFAHFAFRLWVDRDERRATLRQTFIAAAASILFLAPWMALMQLSSRTFLYPLLKGNEQASFSVLDSKLSLLDTLKFEAEFYLGTPYVLLFIPMFLVRDKRIRNSALVMAACNLFISGAMTLKFTASDAPNLYRYLMPLGLGFLLYTCGHLIRPFATATTTAQQRKWIPITLGGVLVLVIVASDLNHAVRTPFQRVGEIITALHPKEEFHFYVWTQNIVPSAVVEKDYTAGMSHVPAGAHVLCALDFPFLIDYRNHHIDNVDEVGIASPPPGLPSFQGAEALKQYLLSQGITYIAQTPPDTGHFMNGRIFETYDMKNDRASLQRKMARYALDFMKNEDDLAATNKVLYQSSLMRIIDLQSN